jgi:hypothetical protein
MAVFLLGMKVAVSRQLSAKTKIEGGFLAFL